MQINQHNIMNRLERLLSGLWQILKDGVTYKYTTELRFASEVFILNNLKKVPITFHLTTLHTV